MTVSNLGGGAGLVTANATGTAHITYTLTSGCAVTTTITVNPLPGLITGTTHVCIGTATTLSNAVTGGVWSSGMPTIATAGSATGIVTGVATGVAYITYTLPTGCKADTAVHVNPDPAMIVGYPTMIVSTTTTYTDATTGGVWSSSNPAVATIGAGTGSAYGVAAGVVTFSYTISTGCAATKVVSVNILGGASPRGSEENTSSITDDEIRLTPNPNKGTFTISGTLGTAATKHDEEVWLELTDMLGQVVYRNKIQSHEGKIEEDVVPGNVANGMYLMNVRWSDGNRVMHVVVSR